MGRLRIREGAALYAQLGIPQRTEIEFFDGGHEIHGVGTFRFLREQLKWRGDGQGR